MPRQPQISVCVPTYNRSRYLREALDSILRQSFEHFEIVVFDDASTDDTVNVVQSIPDLRLRYFRQPRNVGIGANRNSCLDVARGEYIAWLDSDDLYHPRMLATQKAALDANPEVGLVHGSYLVIDRDGRRLPDWPMPFQSDVVESGRDAFRELVVSNYVAAPTVMLRRRCYDAAGRYAEDVSGSEDWDMWLRVALSAGLAYTAAPVASYRYHPASVSAESALNGERLRKDAMIIDRIFGQHGSRIEERNVLRARAEAALASRALLQAGERLALGRGAAALVTLDRVMSHFRSVGAGKAAGSLRTAILQNDEYGCFRHSKALLRRLHLELGGTRYARSLEKVATTDSAWERTLEQIAETVTQVVPEDGAVAVIDKCDPTILHLSGRRGWHFPDRRLLPEGYPSDSAIAIRHLEELRGRGADYIVVPRAAFWWLDHYLEFKDHLDGFYTRAWSDDTCVIYQLGPAAPAGAGAV